MKKLIILCLIAFTPICSAESEHKLFLLEAVKIGNKIQEITKGKNLVEKLPLMENFSNGFTNNPVALNIIMQELGVQYSFAGLHKKVLVAKDRTAEKDNSILENLTEFEEADAVNEILKYAKTHQIVMINEAHDIVQHRVLTYRLLPKLWKQGYRYFAAESLNSSASNQLDKGYVTSRIGAYTRETIYANLVLRAKKIGFEIISYDMHKPSKLNTINEREINSAQTIKEKVFDREPNAKIIIHVGYSHIREDKWLASKLKAITKLETLTIDQTKRVERSNALYEHPTYKKAVKEVKVHNPFIFLNNGNPWSSDSDKWDISVFWPRTVYQDGRPDWATLGRKKHYIDSKVCKNLLPCMIEVFKFNHEKEIPTDRAIITSAGGNKAIFLSEGNNIIVITNSKGKQVFKTIVAG